MKQSSNLRICVRSPKSDAKKISLLYNVDARLLGVASLQRNRKLVALKK